MPQTKSAAKRLRQDIVRRERNRSARQALRTQCRKVREAVKAGDLPKADAEFKTVVVKLDQAGARGVIHANSAARTKSRLSAAVKGLKQAKKA
jgi:small subunit ribosomal protein S20